MTWSCTGRRRIWKRLSWMFCSCRAVVTSCCRLSVVISRTLFWHASTCSCLTLNAELLSCTPTNTTTSADKVFGTILVPPSLLMFTCNSRNEKRANVVISTNKLMPIAEAATDWSSSGIWSRTASAKYESEIALNFIPRAHLCHCITCRWCMSNLNTIMLWCRPVRPRRCSNIYFSMSVAATDLSEARDIATGNKSIHRLLYFSCSVCVCFGMVRSTAEKLPPSQYCFARCAASARMRSSISKRSRPGAVIMTTSISLVGSGSP